MRNYALFIARSQAAYGQLTWLATWWRNRIIRRDLRRLQHFDGYMLKDIGLTAHDVAHLLGRRRGVDLFAETERLRLINSRFAGRTRH